MARRIQKIYLDTSVISALFDDRMPERKHLTEEFWEKLHEQEAYFSTVGKEEISFASDEVREKMLAKIKELKILEVTEEVEDLADEYIRRGIFPKPYRDDAIHAAVAVVNNMDFMVSWNYKHLVKVKTRRMLNLTNEVLGYPLLEIIAPPEL